MIHFQFGDQVKVLDETSLMNLRKSLVALIDSSLVKGVAKICLLKEWLWVGSTPLAHCVGNYYGDIRKYIFITVYQFHTSITDNLYPIKYTHFFYKNSLLLLRLKFS